MKARILPLVTFLVSHAAETPQDREIHIHWDVNKTIIAMDAVQGKKLEETVNGVLAEFTFEKWDGIKQQSYYSFLTDCIARENPQLSRADEIFKQKRAELLRAFPNYLTSHKELHAKYLDEKRRMLQILHKDTMVIFPSFFKCIAWLEREYPHKYALYLRTFGTDLPEVVPAIERQSSLKFAGVGHFSGRTVNIGKQAHSLHDFFKNPGLAHYAIRDDYAFWKSHGFQ